MYNREEVEAPNKSKNKKPNKRILFTLLALLFLFISTLLYFVFRPFPLPFSLIGPTMLSEEEQTGKNISKIFLTLNSTDSLHSKLNVPSLNIYTLNLEDFKLEKLFEETEDILDNMMPNLSINQSNMVFVRRYSDYLSQILLIDMGTGDLIEITMPYALLERNPVLSHDGRKVTYWVFESSENPFDYGRTPEDHLILLTSVGDENFIERVKANGVFPTFLQNDEYLLYLKNDGLYTLDLASDDEKLILELDIEMDNDHAGYPLWLSWRFNISPNEDFLVITNSMESRVTLIKINSWSPFEFEEVLSEISIDTPIWPVFSPDGDYFVVQSGNQIKEFDLEGREVRSIFDLSENGFDSQTFWIGDWIIE